MNHKPILKKPEILAPAGDLNSLNAAISAGADAVYFGVDGLFNARAKSEGISSAMLEEIVTRCHQAGLKALVTINTLIFESELSRVSLHIEHIAQSGVDALIVQDPAVALLAREIAPSLEVHASTQMTISSPEAAHFAKDLGVTRVVVPRELTVGQIRKFKEQCDLELEVFIHGALCMSWSGQCLTSEAWGGRSANRGQCAQSCRMPYDLLVDDEVRDLGEIKYLLSPRDLAGVRAVESLMEIGIECLKIEGRYKGPSYVKQAVESYQSWIRSIQNEQVQSLEAQQRLATDLTGLSLSYSRGFSDGFLGGSDHQSLVEGRFPKHRGVFLGYVVEVNQDSVRISRQGDGRKYNRKAKGRRSDPLPLYHYNHETESNDESSLELEHLREQGPLLQEIIPEPGMGIVFDDSQPETNEYGGRLAKVQQVDGGLILSLHQGKSKARLESRVRQGQRVWLNHDPQMNKQVEKALQQVEKHSHFSRLPIDIHVQAQVGKSLNVTACLAGDHTRYQNIKVNCTSSLELTLNQGRPLDEHLLKSKLGSLGNSPFYLQNLSFESVDPCGLPVSNLKQIRREMVSALTQAMFKQQGHSINSSALVAVNTLKSPKEKVQKTSSQAQLIPLCRTMEQLEAVIELGLAEVELDWMEFVGLRQAVERAKSAGLKVTIATVRVQKPGESGYDQRIASLKPDGVLIRHWGALNHFASLPEHERPILHGDYSLNITNSISAHHVKAYGLQTLTASHDLDQVQLFNLLSSYPAEAMTVTIHHHIPTFHTEHCVYAHLLSDGRDFKSCGRPCEAHRVALRDHKGKAHPVLVDVECRNTVFNASAQTAASLVDKLQERNLARFRLEFVWETKAQTRLVIETYQALIRGDISSKIALDRLGTHERFGLSAGTMEVLS